MLAYLLASFTFGYLLGLRILLEALILLHGLLNRSSKALLAFVALCVLRIVLIWISLLSLPIVAANRRWVLFRSTSVVDDESEIDSVYIGEQAVGHFVYLYASAVVVLYRRQLSKAQQLSATQADATADEEVEMIGANANAEIRRQSRPLDYPPTYAEAMSEQQPNRGSLSEVAPT